MSGGASHSLPGPHPGRSLCKWVLGVCECAHVNAASGERSKHWVWTLGRAGGSGEEDDVSGTLKEDD